MANQQYTINALETSRAPTKTPETQWWILLFPFCRRRCRPRRRRRRLRRPTPGMPSPFTDRSAGACLACCFLAAATLIFALLDKESGLDDLLLPSDVDPEPVQSSPAKQPRATGHRRDAALRAEPRRPAFTDKVVLDAAAVSVGMRGGRSRAAGSGAAVMTAAATPPGVRTRRPASSSSQLSRLPAAQGGAEQATRPSPRRSDRATWRFELRTLPLRQESAPRTSWLACRAGGRAPSRAPAQQVGAACVHEVRGGLAAGGNWWELVGDAACPV